jgi:hypothetical protein
MPPRSALCPIFVCQLPTPRADPWDTSQSGFFWTSPIEVQGPRVAKCVESALEDVSAR